MEMGERNSDKTSLNSTITTSMETVSRKRNWFKRLINPQNAYRYKVAVLTCVGFGNIYALRANFSVAIVAMTSTDTTRSKKNDTYGPEFEWNVGEQGIALSAFFYGYIITQFPGGYLAAKYGGAHLFCLGVFVTALLSMLLPAFAKLGLPYLVSGRIIQGLSEGLAYPANHALWSKWAPPLEHSRLTTIAFSGSYFGTMIAMPLSGWLGQTFKWYFIFYVFGMAAMIWCFFWFKYVTDIPITNQYISAEELNYIHSAVGVEHQIQQDVKTPCKKMFLSVPVWAIIVAHFTENWGFYTLLTEFPTYLNDEFGYDLKSAGILAAVPYFAMGLSIQAAGFAADCLRSSGLASTTWVRKLFTTGAFGIQALFIGVAYNFTSPTAIVACISIAIGFGGFAWAGFGVNHLDIAPAHAAVLMGITNTFGTLPGILSPLLTAYIRDNKELDGWKTVFRIAGLIYVVGGIFYFLCASGEKQVWAENHEQDNGDCNRDGNDSDNVPPGENQAFEDEDEEEEETSE